MNILDDINLELLREIESICIIGYTHFLIIVLIF
jgi:hypothetical protein